MAVKILIGSLLGLLIVTTSGVLPVVVARYQHLRTATNYHLCIMSIADCVVGLLFIFYPWMRTFWPSLAFSGVLCALLLLVNLACSTVSNVTMFWLALDRRTAVRNPLLYPLLVTRLTVRRQLLQTLGLVMLLAGYVITSRLLTDPSFPDEISQCFLSWQLVLGHIGTLVNNGVNLVVSCATIFLCVEVLLVARRTLRSNVAALPHELAERARLRKHVRTFYYLLRVMVLYGVCLIPFSVSSLLKAFMGLKASLEDGATPGGGAEAASVLTMDSEEPQIWFVVLTVLRGSFHLVDSWLFCSSPELRHAILHYFGGDRFDLYP
ncbi:histamine H2 receptor-like [Amphibalanus amphitrite]|uniref:histamine H2 receptor-like n=1 Tax=Amphibalanus amphitrite TaxID=1232801 RepID=UPI001C8FFA1B|nr:histamine H2 receptor-like [Amphibalanus amphitrite]